MTPSAGLRRLHRLTLCQKKPANGHSDDQANSLLFTLPAELREMIWYCTLATSPGTQPAHFHIYDDVYDPCTYHAQSPETLRLRHAANLIALLRTCRRIHIDAGQTLYDNTEFEVVVFSGHARPDHLRLRSAPPEQFVPGNLKHRHGLGSIASGPLWRRMRQITLVVQPGKRPHMDVYERRVEGLLRALDGG